ncbi:MAG: segregation and condensation protein segregation and condensation protein, partial [Candidatus Parcubacteria bacterium]
MDTTYSVKTGTFEGPFDVLLDLIERRKLFINDISLSQVTDDFLTYIKSMENAAPSTLSSFIVVAATLILIKSRSLLPNFSLTKEEEKEVGDLEKRLRLYRMFIDLGEEIKSAFGKKVSYEKRTVTDKEPIFLPSVLITQESMHQMAQHVLSSIPKIEKLPEVEVKKVMSIEEMLVRLTDRMQDAMKTSFKQFVGVNNPANREEKVLVIVGFLAMLELVRQGIMDVLQGDIFGDIEMSKLDADVSATV